MTYDSGFPRSFRVGDFRVVHVRTTPKRVVRRRQPFCLLATADENERGAYGLMQHDSGDLDEVRAAAQHASIFGGPNCAFVVEEIATKTVCARFVDGRETAL